MSIQFGKCNFDGRAVDPEELDRVRPLLASYGPDGEGYLCKNNLGILYRAFYTTHESQRISQPYTSRSGGVITWTGRLDNREELIDELALEKAYEYSDFVIVAAAYERWRTNSFRKLIGDWALSICDPEDHSVILARDFVGTRQLYYSVDNDRLTWCSILDPLILFEGRSLELNEEYIAGWLAFFPAAHLTPYSGIHSVAPGSLVYLAKGKQKCNRYWEFDPAKQIRYRSDGEYEEHFRVVFSQSVRRRLRSITPVLAELSGGMDSSSIVCMADEVMAQGFSGAPRLDTVSYYNDLEPNWNEQHYFAKVEEKRGRTGFHIDVSSQPVLPQRIGSQRFATTPSSVERSSDADRYWKSCLTSEGYRVVLSGIGGDEVTGGVPTGIPEIADALARARFGSLVSQLKSWCLATRQPWIQVLAHSALRFCCSSNGTRYDRAASWLRPDFRERNQAALCGYPSRLRLFGSLPSFQENMATLEMLRREMSCTVPAFDPPYEKRYPFLDRDLLEFLYAIPGMQIQRPRQRRSLLRRALGSIVPEEVLNRKRKGFVASTLMRALASQAEALIGMSGMMLVSRMGIVDATAFCELLDQIRRGKQAPFVGLIRVCELEQWLQAVCGSSRSARESLGGAEQLPTKAQGLGNRGPTPLVEARFDPRVRLAKTKFSSGRGPQRQRT